jgi:hypothetical protein
MLDSKLGGVQISGRREWKGNMKMKMEIASLLVLVLFLGNGCMVMMLPMMAGMGGHGKGGHGDGGESRSSEIRSQRSARDLEQGAVQPGMDSGSVQDGGKTGHEDGALNPYTEDRTPD